MVWAFVTAGWLDVSLFVTLARTADQHIGEFSTQGLTNMVWAFGMAAWSDSPLFVLLARAVEWRTDGFNP